MWSWPYSQDGDQADDDDDDDEGPREANLEGRVEKYIGVKVKACTFMMMHSFHFPKYDNKIFEIDTL